MDCHPNGNKITFHLQELTKNFNFRTAKCAQLQQLTIRSLPSSPALCPVKTLHDYLSLSHSFRRGEDKLFILLGNGYHLGLTHQITIVRWVKNHFKGAGLGNFSVHSTRASASTNALLLGMSVDDIVAKVGWLSNSTFVKRYMRLLQKSRNKLGALMDDSPGKKTGKTKSDKNMKAPQTDKKTETVKSQKVQTHPKGKRTDKNQVEYEKKKDTRAGKITKKLEKRDQSKAETKGNHKSKEFMTLWQADKRFVKWGSCFKQQLDKAQEFVSNNRHSVVTPVETIPPIEPPMSVETTGETLEMMEYPAPGNVMDIDLLQLTTPPIPDIELYLDQEVDTLRVNPQILPCKTTTEGNAYLDHDLEIMCLMSLTMTIYKQNTTAKKYTSK